MKAVRFSGVGKPAAIADVPQPKPGPGQALVKIGGAGVCRSDLHVMDHDIGRGSSFTLGHENRGWIAGLGQGAAGFTEGDPVAIALRSAPFR